MRSSRSDPTQSGSPPSHRSSANKASGHPRSQTLPRASAGSAVDPVWLLKALSVSLGVALLCGYSSFCLLFYQGQWQLVLHPTRVIGAPLLESGKTDGATTQEVHFAPDVSGKPQLQGWWIPAAADGRYCTLTLLYLASEDGQASTASSLLLQLHRLGLNVFAFDYRGFGGSASVHPSEERMKEDAAAALAYLSTTREILPAHIVVYGTGVGASLAVSLASVNHAIAGIVLDSPQSDLLPAALADPRARILPVRLLFKERFLLFPDLAHLRTPKLILTSADSHLASSDLAAAADPKAITFTNSKGQLPDGPISHFLNEFNPVSTAPEPIHLPTLPAPSRHVRPWAR